MRNIFRHELTKLFLFLFLSFLGAALLTPHLYTWGKNLAAEAATSELSAPMEWLATKCDRAQFSRYFNRALMACALLLLFPLIRSLKTNNGQTHSPSFLKRIRPDSQNWKDLGAGILFSIGFLTLLALLLYQINWLQQDPNFQFGKAFRKAIIPAIIVSLLEEWLFRGVLYNVLMRQLSAIKTIISLSLFFAALHFLSPPKGATISDPHSLWAGFEMLQLIGQKFLNPFSFIGIFLTLFTVGVILAYTRYRTGTLWLAIGLHTGWIFALKMTNALFDPTGTANPLFFNANITDGLFPLITLAVTGLSLRFYLRTRSP